MLPYSKHGKNIVPLFIEEQCFLPLACVYALSFLLCKGGPSRAEGDSEKRYGWSPKDCLQHCEWSGGTSYSALDGPGGRVEV